MDSPLAGEIVPTPGRRKAHAAIVKDGHQILFVFPVDSIEEGHARIDQAIALVGELQAGLTHLPPPMSRPGN